MKLVRQQTTRVGVPELAEGKYTHIDTRVFVQCNHAFIPAKVFIATLLMRGRGGEEKIYLKLIRIMTFCSDKYCIRNWVFALLFAPARLKARM